MFDFEPISTESYWYNDKDDTLIEKGVWGFYSLTLAQSERQQMINFQPLSIGGILGTVGARAISLYGLFAIAIASYESFSFDKSVLKSFYKEDTLENFTDATDIADDDYRARMRNQMHLTSKFTMSYCTYLTLRFINTFCCCCLKYFNRDGSWFKRENTRLKRLDLAKEKLQSELSLHKYIRNFRLSNFAYKVRFNRRQRESVKYFRRNTIKSSDLDQNGRKERNFDQNRIVEECNYDLDINDRRILYEMTGSRMNHMDFLDETTDSEFDLNSDADDNQETQRQQFAGHTDQRQPTDIQQLPLYQVSAEDRSSD